MFLQDTLSLISLTMQINHTQNHCDIYKTLSWRSNCDLIRAICKHNVSSIFKITVVCCWFCRHGSWGSWLPKDYFNSCLCEFILPEDVSNDSADVSHSVTSESNVRMRKSNGAFVVQRPVDTALLSSAPPTGRYINTSGKTDVSQRMNPSDFTDPMTFPLMAAHWRTSFHRCLCSGSNNNLYNFRYCNKHNSLDDPDRRLVSKVLAI